MEMVDEFELAEIKEAYESIVSQTSDLNLKTYQLCALVSRYYNCGSSGWKTERNNKTFFEAYDAYWSEDLTEEYFGDYSNSNIYNESMYTTYMSAPTTSKGEVLAGLVTRRKSEWLLFATGYDNRTNTQWTGDEGSSSDIVSVATTIHDYMRENSYAYSCTHNVYDYNYGNNCTCNTQSYFGLSYSAGNYYNIRCMDCSTYVSWVLIECGYMDDRHSSYFYYNGDYLTNSYTSQFTWTKITDWNELQAGDILVRYKHVEFYIGDGYVLSAGSTNGIRSEKTSKSISEIASEFSFALRVSN